MSEDTEKNDRIHANYHENPDAVEDKFLSNNRVDRTSIDNIMAHTWLSQLGTQAWPLSTSA